MDIIIIDVLLIITKKWTQLRYLPTNEWIMKVEFYSVVKTMKL